MSLVCLVTTELYDTQCWCLGRRWLIWTLCTVLLYTRLTGGRDSWPKIWKLIFFHTWYENVQSILTALNVKICQNARSRIEITTIAESYNKQLFGENLNVFQLRLWTWICRIIQSGWILIHQKLLPENCTVQQSSINREMHVVGL